MKNLVFISHSTHQDDYCAAWLASKLKGIGYNVWLDLNDLSTGDSFNTVIKPIIQQEAGVFIPITTKSYCEKSDNQNSGVSRELNCAVTVNTRDLKHNFILPVKFDDVDYNNFPYQYLGWNCIDFSNNWQEGLIDLVKNLEDIKIGKLESVSDPIALWFEAIKAENKVMDRKETYFTNWLLIDFPEYAYLHSPEQFKPEEIYSIPFPFITDSNRLLSFAGDNTIKKYTALKDSFKIDAKLLREKNEILFDDGFALKDCKSKLIWLLNKTFQNHLLRNNLICWNRGTSKVFYFKHPKDSSGEFINLKRYNKPRGRRAITGQVNPEIDENKLVVNWALGIRPKAELDPFPHYRIGYSLVFSNQDFKRFEKTTHHKLRRTVPVGWYNRKWFETLLAALLKISSSIDSEVIKFEIDDNKYWEISNEPLKGEINKGYIEPSDED